MTAPASDRFNDACAHLELLMPADHAVPGWRGLDLERRWNWFQQLYEQAAHLERRYRLGLRSGWWEDDLQIEILATLGAWVAMFDYANWTDPEAKARLILGLPAVRELLRGGAQQLDRDRNRHAFEQHLHVHLACQQAGNVGSRRASDARVPATSDCRHCGALFSI
jgi:hypothetical protein